MPAMNRTRRTFLAEAAGLTLPLLGFFKTGQVASAHPASEPVIPDYEAVASKIKPYFHTGDDALWHLTVQAFQNCILGNVHEPVPPFKHRWLASGGLYQGQWLWDAQFALDLLSILPDQRQLIREVFQNYWDFQKRWDAIKPDYAKGMIACVLLPETDGTLKKNKWDWTQFPAFSQIPILAWGLERVYRRNHDMELVRTALGPLEQFHDWYWRERDVAERGLVGVGAYSGIIQHGRWETYDLECNLDDLHMTAHPRRKGPDEGKWYGDISLPGNSAYLILAERSLARMAQVAGDTAMAKRRTKRITRCISAMRKHMWDEEAGTFLAVHRDSLEKIRIPTIGSWIPLMAGVPTRRMAARMAEVLAGPEWMTPLPVPTVGRHDPHWVNSDNKTDGYGKQWLLGSFWRGDVWPGTNYQIVSGLASYGYKELAARIADAMVANAIKNGISERYDCDTGRALGVPYVSMSCSMITMVLDGLSRRYSLRLV